MPRIAPSTVPPGLGRRARSLSGPVTGRAAGNSVVTSDMRGGARPAAFPGRASGAGTQSSTRVARQTGLITPTTPDVRGPDQARTAYGGGWADGRLTIRERFVQVMRGTSRQGAQESHSGVPNPQEDGPPAAQYLMDNRTLSWQIGTDLTTQEDNSGPFAVTITTAPPQRLPQNVGGGPAPFSFHGGRAFPLGTQGDPWSTVWGGTPGMVRDYGVRGVSGVTGPAPKTFALPGDGSGKRIGTLIAPGDPGDGPQKVRGGVPHGLHSPTIQATKVTMARQAAIPQQKPPRDDRPANSKIAGQSMSQMYPSEGSTSSARTPRMPNPGRAPGIISTRFVRRT